MKEPFFVPHIGIGFKNPQNNIFGGLKILVLGHNHYCNTLYNVRKNNKEAKCGCDCPGYVKECNSFTNDVVAKFLSYCNGNDDFDWFMNTYSKFANALSGYEHSRQDVWNNIAFYNYCQRAVSYDSEQPTANDYIESQEAFLKVLHDNMPDVILCWGFDKVYMNTPNEGWTAPDGEQLGYYTINGKKIPMFHIHHPSWSGFSPDKEHASISKYTK